MRFTRLPIGQLQAALCSPRQALRRGDPEFTRMRRVFLEARGTMLPVWNEATGDLIGGREGLRILVDGGATMAPAIVVNLPAAPRKAPVKAGPGRKS